MSATSGCGIGLLIQMLFILILCLLVIFIGPILIVVGVLCALGWVIIQRLRGQPVSGATLATLGALTLVGLLASWFAVWVWSTTAGNMANTAKVPEIYPLTLGEAQGVLRGAGFTDIRVNSGTTSTVSSDCEVSGSDPAQLLNADIRKPIVLEVWCPSGSANAQIAGNEAVTSGRSAETDPLVELSPTWTIGTVGKLTRKERAALKEIMPLYDLEITVLNSALSGTDYVGPARELRTSAATIRALPFQDPTLIEFQTHLSDLFDEMANLIETKFLGPAERLHQHVSNAFTELAAEVPWLSADG